MTKGVISPWATPKGESAKEQTERLIDESSEGAPKREITFDGRAFQLVVSFFSFDRDQPRLASYAHDALGRAISAALKVGGTLKGEFERQSIYTDESRVLAPKVTVRLGGLTLYVKASSFDSKMAQLMAMDRIALALADARNESKEVRRVIEEHDVVIARKA